MPYSSTSRLPASVKNSLPKGAQTIYRKAFENAWEEYKDADKRRSRSSREEAAHKVAWSAVKTKYKKNDEGKWSREDAGNGGSAARSSRKSSMSKAKSAGSKTAAAKPKKKSARKSSGTAKKTAGDKPQARWKTASTKKAGGQKSRGKAASSRAGTRSQQTRGQQQKRKPRKSTGSTIQQREALPALETAGLNTAGVPQQEPQSERATRQENTGHAS